MSDLISKSALMTHWEWGKISGEDKACECVRLTKIDELPTVETIPMSVITDIKANIDQYLINNEFGYKYRRDIEDIIDQTIEKERRA